MRQEVADSARQPGTKCFAEDTDVVPHYLPPRAGGNQAAKAPMIDDQNSADADMKGSLASNRRPSRRATGPGA